MEFIILTLLLKIFSAKIGRIYYNFKYDKEIIIFILN